MQANKYYISPVGTSHILTFESGNGQVSVSLSNELLEKLAKDLYGIFEKY